jgi:TolB-like protein
MGDGALCEFASVVDAVACAVAIQRGMAEREAEVPEAERICFRIGINSGDVIVEGEDIYGDGVNVAARLEGLAEPGGICVSGRVRDEIARKLAVGFAPLGRQRVKNIAEPVEVWRVLPGGATAGRRLLRAPTAPRRGVAAVAVAVLLLAAAGVGGWWYWSRGAAMVSDKPSVAVLPLANLSGDPRWERFADGVTENLITDLARDPNLHVIARNSTLAYKGKAVDVRRVGQDLGVRYVLEGSIQAAAGRVRVTAQLVDASTGGHLWAERYDRPEADLFAIQDEVTQSVAGALGGWYGRLNKARREEARRRPPASLDAYDLYLLGLEQKHKFTKESMAAAIRLFSRAVDLDPGFARGWTMLGLAYNLSVASGFVDDPVAANRLFAEYTKKATDLDPFDPFTQAMLGNVRGLEGDPKGAEVAFDRAVALAPNDPNTLIAVAWCLPLMVGRADEARAARATRDGPGPGVAGGVRPRARGRALRRRRVRGGGRDAAAGTTGGWRDADALGHGAGPARPCRRGPQGRRAHPGRVPELHGRGLHPRLPGDRTGGVGRDPGGCCQGGPAGRGDAVAVALPRASADRRVFRPRPWFSGRSSTSVRLSTRYPSDRGCGVAVRPRRIIAAAIGFSRGPHYPVRVSPLEQGRAGTVADRWYPLSASDQ